MLKAVPKDQKKFDTNSKPLLEVTWEEILCLENTWRINKHAKSIDVIVLWAEIKIACLVSQLTMTKIVSNLEDNRSFLTYLPSQLVDCVGQASYIQGPKSRKNQVEWHRSLDTYNY